MANILLPSSEYYSQRNNKYDPLNACMPTSYVMYLIANKIPYTNKSMELFDEFLPDDDFIYRVLNTDEAKDFCYKKYTWAKNIPPNEVHGMYSSYLEPIICGKRYSDFYTNLNYDKVVTLIDNDVAVMTSGKFENIDGHAFTIIGHDRELLIADPYGNFHSNYKDVRGYCITMNRSEYEKIVKGSDIDNKWGHAPLSIIDILD